MQLVESQETHCIVQCVSMNSPGLVWLSQKKSYKQETISSSSVALNSGYLYLGNPKKHTVSIANKCVVVLQLKDYYELFYPIFDTT